MTGAARRRIGTCAGVLAALGLALPAVPSSACDDGLPKVAYLGISNMECDCTTSFSIRSTDGKRTLRRLWTFRSEPEVRDLAADGPSAGKLREGDVITAVDGMLITTREGSARFSSFEPGQVVRFTVRREAREITVPISVGSICPEELTGVMSLGELIAPMAPTPAAPATPPAPEVAPTPRTTPTPPVPPAAPAPAPPARWFEWSPRPDRQPDVPTFTPKSLPRGWLGIGLTCQECGGNVEDEKSAPVWTFGSLPIVSYVDPEGPSARAGIRRGDQLTHIDGISLITDEGGKRFGAVKPGQVVRWRLIRDGSARNLTVTAAARPGGEVDLGDLREKLRALREQSRRSAPGRDYAELLRQLAELERLQGTPAPQATPRRLRYAGAVAGSDVEVRGLNNVVVDDSGDEIVIITRDATIRIRPSEKSGKPGRERDRK